MHVDRFCVDFNFHILVNQYALDVDSRIEADKEGEEEWWEGKNLVIYGFCPQTREGDRHVCPVVQESGGATHQLIGEVAET